MLEFSSLIVNLISSLADGSAPWFVYALIVLIPFSILIAIREAYCWFNKVNKVVNRLEKLDKRILALTNSINNLATEFAKQKQTKIKTEVLNPDSDKDDPAFFMDKDWTKK